MTVLLGLVLGLGAVAAAWVLLRRPAVAVSLWVGIEVLNAGNVLVRVTGVSVANPAMALAVLSVGIALVGRFRRGESVRPPGDLLAGVLVAGLGVLYVLAQLPALVINGEGDSLAVNAPDLVRSLIFLAVVVLGATYLFSPWVLVGVMVTPLGLLGGYTFVDFAVLGGSQPLLGFAVVSDALGEGAATPRYQGPFEDTNVWGRVLVVAAPFAVSLMVRAAQSGRRAAAAWWTLMTIGVGLGTYLTQSRGAMLALAGGAVVWWLLSGPKPRWAKVGLPVAGLAFLAVPGVGSRILSLEQLVGGERVTDYALVERAAAQRVALETFRDHPLIGVGDPELYFEQYAQYADIVLRRQVAPHNLYLQLAASGGVVLLLTWLCLIGASIVVAWRISLASRHLDETGRAGSERLLAAASAGALAGWSVCSLFLHMIYPRSILLVVGIVAAAALVTPVRTLTRREVAPREDGVELLLTRAAVVGVVLGVAMLLAPQVARVSYWSATVTVPVLPEARGEGEFVDGYSYDIVTRTVVIPTYAGVFSEIVSDPGRDDVVVSATGDSEEALVTIRVRAPDEQTALEVARRAAREGSAYLNEQPALSSLAVARPGTATAAQVQQLSTTRLVLLLGGALAVGIGVSLHPSWRRRFAEDEGGGPDATHGGGPDGDDGSPDDESGDAPSAQPLAPSSR